MALKNIRFLTLVCSVCWITTSRSWVRVLFPLCEINTIESKYNVWPRVLFLHLVKLMRPSPERQAELMILPRIVKLLPTYSCDLNTALTLTCLGIIPSTWQSWIFRRQSSKCKLSASWKRESWGECRGHSLCPTNSTGMHLLWPWGLWQM